jgi:hypothetical protein
VLNVHEEVFQRAFERLGTANCALLLLQKRSLNIIGR